MKREYIMTGLLGLSIVLIAIGVHTSNLIIAAIGGEGLFVESIMAHYLKKIEL